MGIFDKILSGDSEDEERIVRFNCRACGANFDYDEAGEANPMCPECDETDRIYRV